MTGSKSSSAGFFVDFEYVALRMAIICEYDNTQKNDMYAAPVPVPVSKVLEGLLPKDLLAIVSWIWKVIILRTIDKI